MNLWDLLFSKIVDCRKTLYKKNILKSYRLPVKVLSVGNLTFGGTGKSPFISYLLSKFSDTKKIVVLSRGYGRISKGFFKVKIDEKNAAAEYGDEPVMLAMKHKNVHFYVCEDRVIGIQEILKVEKPDWVFLDDAFQNLKVKKDVSIVIVDATEDISNYHFPPMGRLRSNPTDINEADIKVLTKTNLVSLADIDKIKTYFKCSDFMEFTSNIPSVKNLKNNKILPPCDVFLVSAIARPENFKKNINELGYNVRGHKTYRDHYAYTAEDIVEIQKSAFGLPIVVTEKDYSKLVQFSGFECYVTQLEFKEKTSIEKLYVSIG